MDIDGNKLIFRCVRYPHRISCIDNRELSIHFSDVTVFTGTTEDQYNSDNIKVLTKGSLGEIISKMKEMWDEVKG
jgi:hypothetical protein